MGPLPSNVICHEFFFFSKYQSFVVNAYRNRKCYNSLQIHVTQNGRIWARGLIWDFCWRFISTINGIRWRSSCGTGWVRSPTAGQEYSRLWPGWLAGPVLWGIPLAVLLLGKVKLLQLNVLSSELLLSLLLQLLIPLLLQLLLLLLLPLLTSIRLLLLLL